MPIGRTIFRTVRDVHPNLWVGIVGFLLAGTLGAPVTGVAALGVVGFVGGQYLLGVGVSQTDTWIHNLRQKHEHGTDITKLHRPTTLGGRMKSMLKYIPDMPPLLAIGTAAIVVSVALGGLPVAAPAALTAMGFGMSAYMLGHGAAETDRNLTQLRKDPKPQQRVGPRWITPQPNLARVRSEGHGRSL